MKRISSIVNNAYLFSVITKVFGLFSGIIYSILLARYFGASLRGEAVVVNNYSYIFCLFICLGLYQSYPYFSKISSNNLYLKFIRYISTQFYIFFIIAFLFTFTSFSLEYKLAILLTPIKLAIKQFNYLVLIENPRLRNTTQLKLDLFDILFLSVLFLFTKASIYWLIFFLSVQSVLAFLLALFNLKVGINSFKPLLTGILPYLKYGFVPMITVILMEINYKVDILMLEKFNVSKEDIGIYGLGLLLAEKLWMIPDALKDILLSKLTKGRSADEVARVSSLSLLVMLLFSMIFFLTGQKLILLMYGNEFADAYYVSVVILLGVIGMVFYKMVYAYNVVNGKKNANLYMLTIAAIINIVMNVMFIPSNGIKGAAFASLISYTFCGLLFLYYFCSQTGTPIKNMLLPRKNDLLFFFKMIGKA